MFKYPSSTRMKKIVDYFSSFGPTIQKISIVFIKVFRHRHIWLMKVGMLLFATGISSSDVFFVISLPFPSV